MNLKGKVYKVGEVIQVTDTFKKRQLVIETDEKFTQLINCQLVQDKTDLANNLQIGDYIEAGINLRGREWTDPKTNEVKFFNAVDIWTLEKQQTIAETQAVETPKDDADDVEMLPF